MDEVQALVENNDNIVRWFFVAEPKPLNRSQELRRSRARTFLFESLYRCITKHNIDEAFRLLRVLPRDTTLDPYVLLRFVLILIESNSTHTIHKNVIIYLEALLSKLDISKPYAFIEFLTYFIKNNRIDDARELFAERQRFMVRGVHRILPYIDVNMRCYEFYLNYLGWKDKIRDEEIKPNFDLSTQGWIVNAIDCLKTTRCNYEFFVLCLLRVLIFYGHSKKAYLFMSEFQSNNPDNFGAQLMHYHLLKYLDAISISSKGEESQTDIPMSDEMSLDEKLERRLTDLQAINNFSGDEEEYFRPNLYPVEEDKRRILNNLRSLNPGGRELIDLSEMFGSYTEQLRDLLDGLEVLSEVGNIERWLKIRSILDKIMISGDNDLINEARALWQMRYSRFWRPVKFKSIAGKQVAKKDRKFIKETSKLLASCLDT